MMSGTGPFGPIEMGGMFTVVKIREGLAAGDYKDPGWYAHPAGTVAYEWTGAPPAAERATPVRAKNPSPARAAPELRARKPTRHGGH
jgi:hypothetical protein